MKRNNPVDQESSGSTYELTEAEYLSLTKTISELAKWAEMIFYTVVVIALILGLILWYIV